MLNVQQLLDVNSVEHRSRLRKLLPNGPVPTVTRKRKNEYVGRFLCEECGNMFSTSHNLREHIHCMHPKSLAERKKREVKYFKCDLCTFCASRAAFLQRHIRAVHLQPADKPKDWTCEECNKSFLDKYGLNQHMKLHSPNKFYCKEEDCDSSFPYHSYLLRHCKKFHTPKKELQCKICGLEVADKFHLKKHALVHNEEKRFVCKDCGLRFKFYTALRMHLRTHEDARPFKCPHCSYRCRVLENLRKHVVTSGKHTGLMMYLCKLCSNESGPQFATNCGNDFRSHLKHKHRSQEEANNRGFKQILPFAMGICEDYFDVGLKEKMQIVSIGTESQLDDPPESKSQEQPEAPRSIKIHIHLVEQQRLKSKIKKFMRPSLNIPAIEAGGEVCDSPILFSRQIYPSCDPIIDSALCEVNSNHPLLHIPEFCEPSAMQNIEISPAENFINTQESLVQENQFPKPNIVPTMQNLEFCTSTSTDNLFNVNPQMNLFHETPVIQSNIEAESQLLLPEIQTVNYDATTQGLDPVSENRMSLMEPCTQTVNLRYEEPLIDIRNQNIETPTMDSLIFFDPSTQFLPMQPETVGPVPETPILTPSQTESQIPTELLDIPNNQPMVAAASTQTNDYVNDIENIVPSFHTLQSHSQGSDFYESAPISTTHFIDNASDPQSNCLNMIYPNNTQFLQVQDTTLDNVDATPANMFMLHDKVVFELLNLDPDFINQLGNSLQDFANINAFSDDDFLNNSSY